MTTPTEALAALDRLDDFIARVNGDDRGSCGDINTIRAALARPPAPQSEALDCLSMDDDGDVSIDFRAGDDMLTMSVSKTGRPNA